MTMDIREGAHKGEGQYAESKITEPAAKASRLGVLIWELALCIFSRGAASWSAMMYRIFSCLPDGDTCAGAAMVGVFGLGENGTELMSGAMASSLWRWPRGRVVRSCGSSE